MRADVGQHERSRLVDQQPEDRRARAAARRSPRAWPRRCRWSGSARARAAPRRARRSPRSARRSAPARSPAAARARPRGRARRRASAPPPAGARRPGTRQGGRDRLVPRAHRLRHRVAPPGASPARPFRAHERASRRGGGGLGKGGGEGVSAPGRRRGPAICLVHLARAAAAGHSGRGAVLLSGRRRLRRLVLVEHVPAADVADIVADRDQGLAAWARNTLFSLPLRLNSRTWHRPRTLRIGWLQRHLCARSRNGYWSPLHVAARGYPIGLSRSTSRAGGSPRLSAGLRGAGDETATGRCDRRPARAAYAGGERGLSSRV